MARNDRRYGVLREPLLHFLLLGAGLFALHGWLAGTGALSTQVIRIDRGQVAQIASGFASLHQRAPTAAELRGLVDDAVKEEIFYREALAQGLDRDDVIVRRRMRQKLAFVSEDVDPVPEPTDTQLQQWLQAHPARFAIAPRYAFEQVFVDPSRHGAALQADTAALLQRLRAGDPRVAGDALLLAREWPDTPLADVRAQFGARFATALDTLPPGTWAGPVMSGYGVHLVRLVHRDPAHVPALADVREDVRIQWRQAQRDAANARFYASLRKRYDVRVDFPVAAEPPPHADASGADSVAELRP